MTTTRSMTMTTNRPTFSSSTISTRKKTTTPKQSSKPLKDHRNLGYTWSPSSTYPPPLFGEDSSSGLITATRAIGQFLGAAITVNIYYEKIFPTFTFLTCDCNKKFLKCYILL